MMGGLMTYMMISKMSQKRLGEPETVGFMELMKLYVCKAANIL